jgi:hypothetical protein
MKYPAIALTHDSEETIYYYCHLPASLLFVTAQLNAGVPMQNWPWLHIFSLFIASCDAL